MNEKILADRYKLIEQIGMGGMAIVYRAVDMRTATIQIICQVTDFRLACGVGQHRSALCRRGGDNDILRCADARKGQGNSRARKPVGGFELQFAGVLGEFCTELFHSRQM